MTAAATTKASALSASEHNYARDALAQIAFIRAFEAKAQSLSEQNPPQIVGSMHLCAGQEAVAVGAIAGLRQDDQILATYRGHGWALASDLDPYSIMAELCHRRDGINGGRAGSAYFMAPNTRFIGENSIVGAGTTIACGVALANVHANNGRVVVVTIGDGAMNQGSVHEAFAFASAKSLPIIFIVENNDWSELTATTDMFRISRLAQRASGYAMPSVTVDGTDPIAVRDTIAIAAEKVRSGDGPCLLEFRVPRLWGHYNRDIQHYRSKADQAAASLRDPLKSLGERLIAAGFMTLDEVEATIDEQSQRVDQIADKAVNGALPDPDLASLHVTAVGQDKGTPAILETREMRYIEALNLAMREALEADSKVLVFGEDVGKGGGIFSGSRYLQRDFGAERVFDTPIAENAILGSAVGAAMQGLKPIAEIMWADFIFVALDQIINQAANVRYITGGAASVPMVVRTQQGALPGSCAQHSQSIEAILAHIPGVKVALPSSADDAYTLLKAAIADPDPCVVIEARGLYQTKGTVHISDRPEMAGVARLVRPGGDCTVITWGTMVPRTLEAANLLRAKGIEVSVLDLRWLNPLDEAAIRNAVTASSGRVLIVHEAVRTGGFAGELAIRISELVPDMELTVQRHTTPDVRMPASPVLQEALLPQPQTIADACEQVISAHAAKNRR